MLGCFNTIVGQIWTNSNIRLKFNLKKVTQWLGLSIAYVRTTQHFLGPEVVNHAFHIVLKCSLVEEFMRYCWFGQVNRF